MHPHAVLHRAYPRIRGGNDARHPAGRVVEGLSRIRGGNAKTILGRVAFGGLSPHTRGKLFKLLVHKPVPGPIPAYAGETRGRGD